MKQQDYENLLCFSTSLQKQLVLAYHELNMPEDHMMFDVKLLSVIETVIVEEIHIPLFLDKRGF